MPFILVQESDPNVVYCGENTGWVNTKPPEPPNPMDQAQKFATKDDADKYASTHGMKAVTTEIP